MARYGVACPLPQDEERVRPKMTIFTRQSPAPRWLKAPLEDEMIQSSRLLALDFVVKAASGGAHFPVQLDVRERTLRLFENECQR